MDDITDTDVVSNVPIYKTVCAGMSDDHKVKNWTRDLTFDDILKYIEKYEKELDDNTHIYRFEPPLELILRDYYRGVTVPGYPKNMINPFSFPFNIERLPWIFQYGDNLNNHDFSINGIKITNYELLNKIIEAYCIDGVDTREYRLDKILHTAAFTLRYCCVCGKIYKVSKKKLNEIPLCSRGCKTKYARHDKTYVKFINKCLYCKGEICSPYGDGIRGSSVCTLGCELDFLHNVVVNYLHLTSVKEANNFIKEFNDKLASVYEWIETRDEGT